ncbi:acyl-homoserine-lactone synthase [Vitreimonas flagellata]|uniref:acyl-homoserine-lactone synthase n=1 Tax=Vitreimonas flagellata TaxID=2560861 RepID=UPI0010754E8F|nr:acyl-homoserine-lactone synthase [Vitreimonas flagellata]
MIHIVNAENRRQFFHALKQMHLQRKKVFIDQMGWRLEHIAGVEIDCYDAEDVVYLLEADNPRAPVTGSARLLPTDRPHLLGEVFACLCDEAAPSGPTVWEATRFCPAPDMPKGAARHALLNRIIGAIIETGLLFGIERVTFVASETLAPLAEQAGWSVRPLGPPKKIGRERLRAYVAEIDSEGLKRVRARLGSSGPLTRFTPGQTVQAA